MCCNGVGNGQSKGSKSGDGGWGSPRGSGKMKAVGSDGGSDTKSKGHGWKSGCGGPLMIGVTQILPIFLAPAQMFLDAFLPSPTAAPQIDLAQRPERLGEPPKPMLEAVVPQQAPAWAPAPQVAAPQVAAPPPPLPTPAPNALLDQKNGGALPAAPAPTAAAGAVDPLNRQTTDDLLNRKSGGAPFVPAPPVVDLLALKSGGAPIATALAGEARGAKPGGVQELA